VLLEQGLVLLLQLQELGIEPVVPRFQDEDLEAEGAAADDEVGDGEGAADHFGLFCFFSSISSWW